MMAGAVNNGRRAALSAGAYSGMVGVIEEEDATLRLGFYAPARLHGLPHPPFVAELAGETITVTKAEALPASGGNAGTHAYTLTAIRKEA